MKRKQLHESHIFFNLSFGAYLLAVIYLLFLSRMDTPLSLWPLIGQLEAGSFPTVNLMPFGTISCYIACLIPGNAYANVAVLNLAGNFLIFLPLGFYLPMLSDRCLGTAGFALRVLLVTFCVESIQLFTGLGSFDVDDMLLNLLGAMTGKLLCEDATLFLRSLDAAKAGYLPSVEREVL